MLAYIHPISGGGELPDNELPGGRPPHASNPIVLPPLPGIYPPPGHPNLPVDPGFDIEVRPHPGGGPIVIGGSPENPINLPPGIYPPLPPTMSGKYAILVWVVGVGVRWAVVDAGLRPDIGLPGNVGRPDNTLPETGTPKR